LNESVGDWKQALANDRIHELIYQIPEFASLLPSFNVLGGELQTCSADPPTGWFRDGCCNTDRNDRGLHTVCCLVSQEFLEFARSHGNDLITPMSEHGFPGLSPGDRWCVCAQTWKDAADEGVACPVILSATHEETLQIVQLDLLEKHAVE
jgi:hypothetical protein